MVCDLLHELLLVDGCRSYSHRSATWSQAGVGGPPQPPSCRPSESAPTTASSPSPRLPLLQHTWSSLVLQLAGRSPEVQPHHVQQHSKDPMLLQLMHQVGAGLGFEVLKRGLRNFCLRVCGTRRTRAATANYRW